MAHRGHSLGFGLEQGLEYAAIGSVTNLCSRLCDVAKVAQIVVSRRVYSMVEARALDGLQLKGFDHPPLMIEILLWREEVENVIDAAAAQRRMAKKMSKKAPFKVGGCGINIAAIRSHWAG
jgi:hypothetical protein